MNYEQDESEVDRDSASNAESCVATQANRAV